jgi:hypothetical protein
VSFLIAYNVNVNFEAMKREDLRKILRGKCISDESCEAAIDELLNLHIVSDCDIDDLLNDLDKDAQDYNGYEYGLPITGEWLTTLRATVRTWLHK